jgi:predicted aldo/keto reductase-like oxidoreductase
VPAPDRWGPERPKPGLIVSGKAGINAETTADSYRKEIDLQMEILGVDYLEFFQVGWFSLPMLEHLTKKGGALEALDKARSEGIISHIGFTGHDSPENYIKCIETGIFDSFTVPYSILDRTHTPTIKRAGELGVGVIAMWPDGRRNAGHTFAPVAEADSRGSEQHN